MQFLERVIAFLLSRLEPVITEPVFQSSHAQGYICKHERPRIRFSLTFAKVKICSNLRIRSDEGQHLDGVSPDSMLIPGLTGCKSHCHDNYGGGVLSVHIPFQECQTVEQTWDKDHKMTSENKARASGLRPSGSYQKGIKNQWCINQLY